MFFAATWIRKQIALAIHWMRAHKKLIFTSVVLACAAVIISFAVADPALAQGKIDSIADPSFWTKLISRILLEVASLFLRLALFFLTFIIEISAYNGYLDSPTVSVGWVMVRDITNMFFVVIMLLIAFGTILGIEQYEWKKLIVKFVLAAVFVNFSRLICGVFIDISQIVMQTFVNGIAATAGGNLITIFNLDLITKLSSNVAPETLGPGMFTASVMAVTFAGMVMMTLAIFMFMLAARVIRLWVLIVLSPLAFVMSVVPLTQKFASQWWSEFGDDLVTGPVLLFFIWLSFVSLGSGKISEHIADNSEVPTEHKIVEGSGTEADKLGGAQSAGISQAMSWNNMTNFVIAIGMLFAGAQVASQIGGSSGSALTRVTDFGKRVATIASGVAVGQWLHERDIPKKAGFGVLAGASKVTGLTSLGKRIGDRVMTEVAGAEGRALSPGVTTAQQDIYSTNDQGEYLDKDGNVTKELKDRVKTGEKTVFMRPKTEEDLDKNGNQQFDQYGRVKRKIVYKKNADGSDNLAEPELEDANEEDIKKSKRTWLGKAVRGDVIGAWANFASKRYEKEIEGEKIREKTENFAKNRKELKRKQIKGVPRSIFMEDWENVDALDRMEKGMVDGENLRSAAKTKQYGGLGKNLILDNPRYQNGKFQSDRGTMAEVIAMHEEAAAAIAGQEKNLLSAGRKSERDSKRGQQAVKAQVKAELSFKAREAEIKKQGAEATEAFAVETPEGKAAIAAAVAASKAAHTAEEAVKTEEKIAERRYLTETDEGKHELKKEAELGAITEDEEAVIKRAEAQEKTKYAQSLKGTQRLTDKSVQDLERSVAETALKDRETLLKNLIMGGKNEDKEIRDAIQKMWDENEANNPDAGDNKFKYDLDDEGQAERKAAQKAYADKKKELMEAPEFFQTARKRGIAADESLAEWQASQARRTAREKLIEEDTKAEFAKTGKGKDWLLEQEEAKVEAGKSTAELKEEEERAKAKAQRTKKADLDATKQAEVRTAAETADQKKQEAEAKRLGTFAESGAGGALGRTKEAELQAAALDAVTKTMEEKAKTDSAKVGVGKAAVEAAKLAEIQTAAETAEFKAAEEKAKRDMTEREARTPTGAISRANIAAVKMTADTAEMRELEAKAQREATQKNKAAVDRTQASGVRIATEKALTKEEEEKAKRESVAPGGAAAASLLEAQKSAVRTGAQTAEYKEEEEKAKAEAQRKQKAELEAAKRAEVRTAAETATQKTQEAEAARNATLAQPASVLAAQRAALETAAADKEKKEYEEAAKAGAQKTTEGAAAMKRTAESEVKTGAQTASIQAQESQVKADAAGALRDVLAQTNISEQAKKAADDILKGIKDSQLEKGFKEAADKMLEFEKKISLVNAGLTSQISAIRKRKDIDDVEKQRQIKTLKDSRNAGTIGDRTRYLQENAYASSIYYGRQATVRSQQAKAQTGRLTEQFAGTDQALQLATESAEAGLFDKTGEEAMKRVDSVALKDLSRQKNKQFMEAKAKGQGALDGLAMDDPIVRAMLNKADAVEEEGIAKVEFAEYNSEVKGELRDMKYKGFTTRSTERQDYLKKKSGEYTQLDEAGRGAALARAMAILKRANDEGDVEERMINEAVATLVAADLDGNHDDGNSAIANSINLLNKYEDYTRQKAAGGSGFKIDQKMEKLGANKTALTDLQNTRQMAEKYGWVALQMDESEVTKEAEKEIQKQIADVANRKITDRQTASGASVSDAERQEIELQSDEEVRGDQGMVRTLTNGVRERIRGSAVGLQKTGDFSKYFKYVDNSGAEESRSLQSYVLTGGDEEFVDVEEGILKYMEETGGEDFDKAAQDYFTKTEREGGISAEKRKNLSKYTDGNKFLAGLENHQGMYQSVQEMIKTKAMDIGHWQLANLGKEESGRVRMLSKSEHNRLVAGTAVKKKGIKINPQAIAVYRNSNGFVEMLDKEMLRVSDQVQSTTQVAAEQILQRTRRSMLDMHKEQIGQKDSEGYAQVSGSYEHIAAAGNGSYQIGLLDRIAKVHAVLAADGGNSSALVSNVEFQTVERIEAEAGFLKNKIAGFEEWIDSLKEGSGELGSVVSLQEVAGYKAKLKAQMDSLTQEISTAQPGKKKEAMEKNLASLTSQHGKSDVHIQKILAKDSLKADSLSEWSSKLGAFMKKQRESVLKDLGQQMEGASKALEAAVKSGDEEAKRNLGQIRTKLVKQQEELRALTSDTVIAQLNKVARGAENRERDFLAKRKKGNKQESDSTEDDLVAGAGSAT